MKFIESEFLDEKSNGFQLEKSLIRSPMASGVPLKIGKPYKHKDYTLVQTNPLKKVSLFLGRKTVGIVSFMLRYGDYNLRDRCLTKQCCRKIRF